MFHMTLLLLKLSSRFSKCLLEYKLTNKNSCHELQWQHFKLADD